MPRSEQSGEDNQSVYSFTTQDTATSEEVARRRGPKKYSFHKRFAYQKLNGWRPILAPVTAGGWPPPPTRHRQLFTCRLLVLACGARCCVLLDSHTSVAAALRRGVLCGGRRAAVGAGHPHPGGLAECGGVQGTIRL